MAMIGDVLVKFVADFAEFSKGMEEGKKQLNSFAKDTAKIGDELKSITNFIKGGLGLTALVEVFNQVKKAADDVAASALKIGDAADAAGLTTREFQALKQASRDAGLGADALATAYGNFRQKVEAGQRGNKDQIEAFDKLGIKLLDAQGKLRSTSDLFEQFARKMSSLSDQQRAIQEQGFLGMSGAKVDAGLASVAKGFDAMGDAAQKAGNYIDDGAIARLKDLRKRTEEAKEKWDAFWAVPVATVEARWAERKAAIIDETTAVIGATTAYKDWYDKILAVGKAAIASEQVKREGLSPFGNPEGNTMLQNVLRDIQGIFGSEVPKALNNNDVATKVWNDDLQKTNEWIKNLYDQLLKANKELDDAVRAGGSQSDKAQEQLVIQRQITDELDKQLGKAKALASAALSNIIGPPGPDFPITPKDFGKDAWGKTGKQPDDDKTTKGGGAAKTDDDTIEAQIRRYKALGDVAASTYALISAGQDKRLDDLRREATVQQQVADIVEKFAAKHVTIDAEQKKRLTEAVRANEEQRASIVKLYEDMARADNVQNRMGDGTERLKKEQEDLNRAYATGRLTLDAYNRQMTENARATERARLEAQKLDGGFKGAAASFQLAMEDWIRANDIVASGGKAFGAVMTSLGDVMDVLQGKSEKTFGQIATDFARMLQRIAMEAAVAEGFKILRALIASYAAGGGSVPNVGTGTGVTYSVPGAPTATPTGRAGGGDVYAGQVYRVGEQGPETFVPSVAGRIAPYAGNDNSGNVTVNLDMKQAEGARDPSAALEFGRKVKAAVQMTIAAEKRPGGTLYGGMAT